MNDDDAGDDLARPPTDRLEHGDCRVSLRALGRAIGCKGVVPADATFAQRATGCQVGGISPFNTRRPLRVFVERSIVGLGLILINGGRRGFLIEIVPSVLLSPAGAIPVACALEES